MAVVIKELIIKGKVKGKESEQDIIKLIDSKLSEKSNVKSIKETDKRQIVEECVNAILKELESKFDY